LVARSDPSDPKSKSCIRTIPRAPEVLGALKDGKLACPKGEAGIVMFPTSTGQVEHQKNMLRSLEPIAKDAGVVNKAGEPKYGAVRLPAFLCVVVHQPEERRRARVRESAA
jgi:hypothetical protein